MMISPEAYYEYELKGKSQREILSCIRSLKQQMGSLKNQMENPHYEAEPVMPSAATQLYWTREYLTMAKKAYAEAGGEYRASAADKRAARFLNQLPYLKTIEFSIGGYFGGHNVYQLEIKEGTFHLLGTHFPPTEPMLVDKTVITLDEDREIRTVEELIAYLQELNVEEWLRDYDTMRFGYGVCDGTQWGLLFKYGNGCRPWESGGSNSYPWNFVDFLKLFGETDPNATYEEEEEEPEEYLYCQIVPEYGGRSLSYISEIEDIQPDDIVVIPYGADNRQILGRVKSVECCDEDTAPYPPEYTKTILRRATEDEKRSFMGQKNHAE